MSAPLLLVPGTLCDERVFAPLIDRLGAGASTPPVAQSSVGAAADAVLAIAPRRFVAGGFSLGGFVVLELLRRAPERLAGAVLVASHALPLQPDQAEARRREVEMARTAGMTTIIDTLWPRYVAPARQGDAVLRSVIDAMAEAVGADAFARQAELAITRPDSRDTMRGTTVSVLVLRGAEDAMCPPDRCAATVGTTTIVRTLPGVGHFLPLEAPDAAAAIIDGWMEGLAA